MKTMRGACSGHTIPINVRIRRNFWAWRQFNWGIVRGIAGTEETGVTVEKSVTAKKGLTSEKSLTSEEVSYSPKLQARDGGGMKDWPRWLRMLSLMASEVARLAV
jgi:hypothetical protein